ncbi:MAG: M1 family aminopeptidase [bacterium]|jgi:ABC-type transport system involved in multi-copper enzyme maturation permease subunit
MWIEIFWFDIRYHLRQNTFYVAATAFFISALLLTSTGAGVAFSDVPSTVNRNAPIVTVWVLTFMSLLGLFAITAFVSSSALRDFERNTHMLFFSRPIGRFDYLAGRFAGAMAISIILMLVTAAGMILGHFMPWQDPESVGPFVLGPYGYAMAVLVLPNLLILGGIFFAVAILSRRLLVGYICVVAFLVLQDVAETVAHNFENTSLAGLIEPMGIAAMDVATRYWTISEYAGDLPPVAGGLLLNRVAWLAVALLVLFAGCLRFSYTRAASRGAAKRQLEDRGQKDGPAQPPFPDLPLPDFPAARSFSSGSRLLQLLHQAGLEVSAIVRSTPFLMLLIMGLLVVLTTAILMGEHRGTPVYPVTRVMVESVALGLLLFLSITVIFYSGEVVWAERALNLEEVFGTLPAPDWVYLGSKLLALIIVTAIFTATGILSTIAVQIFRGYFRIELSLYASGFLIVMSFFILFAVLGLFMQVVTGNKFVGYLFTIGVFLFGTAGLQKLGLEHNLYRFPGPPQVAYSDMNGFGHLLAPFLWFKLYWGFLAVILVALAALFWRRGVDLSRRAMLAAARQKFGGPVRAVVLVGLIGFVATGALIYYNTNILNDYLPESRLEALQAEYEKKYGIYRNIAQPRITDVYADVDIYPHERRVRIRGRYLALNKTDLPIDSLHLKVPIDVTIYDLDPGSSEIMLADEDLGYYVYALPEELAPGDSVEISFDLGVESRGFVNNDPNLEIVSNGTFFSNGHYFPSIGYDDGAQLVDRKKRREHGLPPSPRMAGVDSLPARRNNYISGDADWINFETVVSTADDQTAIAPGYLIDEWEEAGRRYFHYKMDAPILNFYSYLSGDYSVRRDKWNDVMIEVFYHEPHTYNIDRMIEAVKASLDYFSANFGPYQHRQVRIIEFPCYRAFAQSFPNTIPFSESMGFVFSLDDDDDIDHVFNVTAHEVAHQWWAHQVIGAAVQGATLMSEALAEYSALMVMEKKYGSAKLRHMLKYELDGYLHGRGREVVEEMPLMLVEDQHYIHYNKGCMVMYALKDYIGEENVNLALSRYVKDMAFQEPPYTNSIEFISYLDDVVPDSVAYILEDMFETITVFSNRLKEATCERLEDGRYLVSMEVEARKFRADGQGVETEIGIDDYIDIGVFGDSGAGGGGRGQGDRDSDGQDGKSGASGLGRGDDGVGRDEEDMGAGEDEVVLFMKKHHITQTSTRIEVVVDGEPARAGIDPYNKLIDRNSGDNVRKVSAGGGSL